MQEIHRDVGIVKTVIIHDLKILVYTYHLGSTQAVGSLAFVQLDWQFWY